MPESPGRFVNSEGIRKPAVGTWGVLYTVPDAAQMIYGVDVCNGGTEDAHIKIAIVPDEANWTSGEPPPYSLVVSKQRVEADTTDGNIWVMPVKHLNPLDKIAVWTDKADVTFYGHGFLYTQEITP